MGHAQYILVNHTPVRVDDLLTWARAFETTDRIVARTDIDGVKVSTVFLGLDYRFGDGVPLVFETMIFGGPHDGYCDRYTTWDEAEAGHQKAVALVQAPDGATA